MDETEIPLNGGNTNSVVRIGETVRRHQTNASATVHRFLTFLHSQGFNNCPEFLGIDDQNRAVLSYISGTTEFPKDLWTSDVYLLAAANMLKKLHALSAEFIQRESDVWLKKNENQNSKTVICHHDFAPYNFIFGDQTINAVIDFDLAGPGDPLTDVAYAAHWMVPISFSAADMQPFSEADISNGSARLKQFCRTYGVDCDTRILDALEAQFLFMSDEAKMTQLFGTQVSAKLKADGHLDHWRKEHAAFVQHRARIEHNFI